MVEEIILILMLKQAKKRNFKGKNGSKTHEKPVFFNSKRLLEKSNVVYCLKKNVPLELK